MDIYTKKSRWKIYLALAGMLIVAISMVYTNYLADQLKEEERKKAETYLFTISKILGDPENPDLISENDCDYTLHQVVMASNTTIPVIIVNDRGGIDFAINFTDAGSIDFNSNAGDKMEGDKLYLMEELEEMQNDGRQPIEGSDQSVWYKDSNLLKLIRYFPFIQMLLIIAFITFGYIGFSSARRAEQNQVWVGMAKETAHQLGTPITAIIGWIEHLKEMKKGDGDVEEVLVELTNDVDRLNLIADRFSKIGSTPALDPINIYEEMEKCRSYMQRRAPRKVEFDFPGLELAPIIVQINSHLFDWVIENLLRNSLDAMSGTGEISCKIQQEKGQVVIDISDTGKGISSADVKNVFQPGFTTKKRGWGLGLSLAKRIVESYHSGKIFVKKSVVNEGTTFTIKLPTS